MTVQKEMSITKKGYWWEEAEEGLGTWEDDDKLVSIQTRTSVLRVLNREGIWAEDKHAGVISLEMILKIRSLRSECS